MLNIITHADVYLTTVSLLEHAQKRRVPQRSDEPEAGPSKFTCRAVDTVPDISHLLFL